MRAIFGPVRDQGKRQTCMAFSASDAHWVIHGSSISKLSVEYAHYSACRRMPVFRPHAGTTASAMLEALALDGQPVEHEWSYLAALPPDLIQYRPPSGVTGLFRHQGTELTTLDQADDSLRNKWPVVFGMSLSMSFFTLTSSTVLNSDNDHTVVARHAVLAVGLYSDPDSGDKGYLIRNSWGAKWGESGYGLVSRSYVEPRTLFLGVYRA
jgi:hypothetical protein